MDRPPLFLRVGEPWSGSLEKAADDLERGALEVATEREFRAGDRVRLVVTSEQRSERLELSVEVAAVSARDGDARWIRVAPGDYEALERLRASAQRPHAAAGATVRARVVVIEDTAVMRLLHEQAARCAAEELGAELRLESVQTGTEALQRVARPPRPDLLIVDLALPGADGLEVIRAARRSEWCRDAQILVVTCCGDQRPLAESFGISGFLEAPVSFRNLQASIAAALARLTSARPRS